LLNSFTPLQLVAITSLVTAVSIGFYRFLFGQDEGKLKDIEKLNKRIFLDIPTRIKQLIFRLARHLPIVQRQIAQARDDTLRSVCANMAKSVKGHQFAQALPKTGLSKVNNLLIIFVCFTKLFRMKLFKNLKNIDVLKRLIIRRVKFRVVFIN
jgi:hypothetical protein